MYKVAIIEDDELQIRCLRDLILATPQSQDLELLDLPVPPGVQDVSWALTTADIVFMDVNLGSGSRNGIELISELLPAGSCTQVVYVSGFLENAPLAYHTPHTWFLAKPVDASELSLALDRAIQALKHSDSQAPLVYRVHGTLYKVLPRDVLYFESSGRKVRICEADRVTEFYAKLSSIEAELPACFVHSHKSFLVNLAHVAKLGHDELEMSDGSRVPVSQRCHSALCSAFVDFATGSL